MRFDIDASSSPDLYKQRLLRLNDQRITSGGVIVLKAQQYRSKEKNREKSLRRLYELIENTAHPPKKRNLTKPTRSSEKKRLETKLRRGQIKAMRGKVAD